MAGHTAEQSLPPPTPLTPTSALQHPQTSAQNPNPASENPTSPDPIASASTSATAAANSPTHDTPHPPLPSTAEEPPQTSVTQPPPVAVTTAETPDHPHQSGVQRPQTPPENALEEHPSEDVEQAMQLTAQLTAHPASPAQPERIVSDVVLEDAPTVVTEATMKEVAHDISLHVGGDVDDILQNGPAHEVGEHGEHNPHLAEASLSNAMDVDSDEKRGEKRPQSPSDDSVVVEELQEDDSQGDESEQKRRKIAPDEELSAATNSKTETVTTDIQLSAPIHSASPAEPSSVEVQEPPVDTPKAPEKPSTGTGMQLMLRSSPVGAGGGGVSLESVPRRSVANQQNDQSANVTPGRGAVAGGSKEVVVTSTTVSEQNEDAMDVEPPRREKKVSFASDEALIDVKYIDTRVELLRSWDPESEITLPFAPGTLQMLKNMSEQKDRASCSTGGRTGNGGGTDPHTEQTALRRMSSFEVARKKEHHMELERAKNAREELQKNLDNMRPARPWVRPAAIVLPAECRIDPDSVESFSTVEDGDRAIISQRDPNSKYPPSPPLELRSPVELTYRSDADVPVFPLHDESPEAGEVPDSNGDTFPDIDADYSIRHGRGGIGGGIQQGYDSSVTKRRDASSGDRSRRDYGHTNGHEAGYGVQSQGMATGADNSSGMMYGGYSENGLGDKNGRSLPNQAVQHLLSALHSSGLLNQSNGGQNSDGPEDYGENKRGGDMVGGSSGMYDEQHAMSRRNVDGNDNGFHSNGGYMEDDQRRGQGMEDGMGSGGGMAVGNGGMGPPPPPPFGHPGQLGAGFGQGVQPGGMMEGFSFPIPSIPPAPMGMPPNMLPMGMGMPMPPMGLPLPFGMPPGPMPPGPMPPGPMPPGPMAAKNNAGNKGGSKSGKSGSGGGRVETITRPKSKGSKQRKKCKYFGTKQGCRDGSSCVFAHN